MWWRGPLCVFVRLTYTTFFRNNAFEPKTSMAAMNLGEER
jgi:hypothetical protein